MRDLVDVDNRLRPSWSGVAHLRALLRAAGASKFDSERVTDEPGSISGQRPYRRSGDRHNVAQIPVIDAYNSYGRP